MRVVVITLLAALALWSCAKDTPKFEDLAGKYTYEQAVRDHGEPIACQDLDQGRRMCSWYFDRDIWGHYDQIFLTFTAEGVMESGIKAREERSIIK